MLKLSARFGIWYYVEHGLGQIDARSDPNRAWVGAEQRSGPLVLIEQSPHCQLDHFGLVSVSQLPRRLLYQCDDVRPIDGNDLSHVIILIMIWRM